MSFQLSGWDQQDDGQSNKKRQIQGRIRMLVKHPEGASETMEQKQQRQDKYEEVFIYAAPFNKGNDLKSYTQKNSTFIEIVIMFFFFLF